MLSWSSSLGSVVSAMRPFAPRIFQTAPAVSPMAFECMRTPPEGSAAIYRRTPAAGQAKGVRRTRNPGNGTIVAMSYELIDHTGDIGVVARAATLEALFSECARAMFEILADAPSPSPSGTDPFPVAGADPAEELRDFLSELLYRFSTDHRMYVAFAAKPGAVDRSEERRVGKECRSRWSRDD